MVKLVYCVRKKADLPAQEFYAYWKDRHGPLVKSVADALGARRYVQSHTVSIDLNSMIQQTKGTREAYDGITELWWDSSDVVAAALASEAGQKASEKLQEDEAKFIDHAGSSVFFTEEHTIFES